MVSRFSLPQMSARPQDCGLRPVGTRFWTYVPLKLAFQGDLQHFQGKKKILLFSAFRKVLVWKTSLAYPGYPKKFEEGDFRKCTNCCDFFGY
jgi:hypothetical protein